MKTLIGSFAAAAALVAQPATAWDCQGHRAITLLALDGFERSTPDYPEWLRPERARLTAASNACEADRFRALTAPLYLSHENNPDHYLDVEKLAQFGLTLSTVPPLRYEYVRALAVAKHEHPDNVAPYNPKLDPSRSQEFPGYGAHAVMEWHGKLASSFKVVRTLEALNDPDRGLQLEAARANALYSMGMLSHFVGDLAQPLHTTEHHHGWIGDNPEGFTTDRRIHAYIDGEILIIHRLDYETLKATFSLEREVQESDPWMDVLDHIQRSHDHVRDIYALFKTGELEKEPGKALIAERLQDGGAMLAAMFASAWRLGQPSEKDVKDFVRYDRWEGIRDAKPNPEARPQP